MNSELDNIKLVVFFFFISFYMLSCKNDSEEELYVNQECNIEAVSFETDIFPIINSYCISCHSGSSSSASGGLLLETYDQIQLAVNKLDEDGVIARIEKSNGDPKLMPPSHRLPQCEIDKIKAWQEQGTNN